VTRLLTRLAPVLGAALLLAAPTPAVVADAPLALTLRSRAAAPGQPAAAAVERKATWDAKKTAIVVCDMWDDHWCKSATARVGELAGPLNDTLKAVRGVEALGHYLRDSAEAVEDCRVQIHETTRTAHGEHLVRWSMMIRFKKLRRGVDTWTVGMSHLRFDAQGHVVYHQDYWNAADGIFQHIPLLGTAIAAIKRRL